MYKLFTANSKTEKILRNYIFSRPDIKDKLDKLKENPTRAIGSPQTPWKIKR